MVNIPPSVSPTESSEDPQTMDLEPEVGSRSSKRTREPREMHAGGRHKWEIIEKGKVVIVGKGRDTIRIILL